METTAPATERNESDSGLLSWLVGEVASLLGETTNDVQGRAALNFFELGLDSIRLVQLQDSVNAHFNVDISILELIEYPSVGQYAMRLSQLLRQERVDAS